MIITKLEELFSVGSHLSDVHPDVRGIPMRQYRMAKITERCSELLRTSTPATKANATISQKRIATPRKGVILQDQEALM